MPGREASLSDEMVFETPGTTIDLVAFGSWVILNETHDLLPTTPLVTCLSGALDRRLLSLLPASLTGGWLVDCLNTQVRQ